MSETIGKHLATLSLFRESDGTVEITIASGSGGASEWVADNKGFACPHDYLEPLIIEAAERMKARKQ